MPLDAPNNSGDNLTTTFRHIEAYLYEIAVNGSGGGDSLPSQTGHAGEYLTTDGTTASWGALAGGGDVVASGVLALNAIALGAGGTNVKTTTTGTGVVTALAVNTGSAGAFVVNGGALGTPASGTLTNATGLPISTGVSGLGTGIAAALAINTGNAGAPVLFNGAGGTPSALVLTNATGLPVSTGISGIGANVATFLATPSSANLAAAVTGETGSGALVFATSPALVTPALGAPSSGTLTNCTGLPISTGVSGLGVGVATFLATPSSANLASAVTGETGSGALVFATSPTLVTPALGTPSSGTLTSCTGLPISTGVSGLGAGVATFLTTPSSANLANAVTGETGSGALVFATSPALTTPNLGTPSSVVLTNATGLPTAGMLDEAVTNAKLAHMAQSTIKGRAAAAGTGDATDLTADQTSTILDGATDPFARTSVLLPLAPLDGFSARLTAAWSPVQQMLSYYHDPLELVREVAGDLESDIYNAGNSHLVDVDVLDDFAAASTLTGKTWYNQVASATDVTQATEADQPVVSDTTGETVFDGTSDYLSHADDAATSMGSGVSFTVMARVKPDISGFSPGSVGVMAAKGGFNGNEEWAFRMVGTGAGTANFTADIYDGSTAKSFASQSVTNAAWQTAWMWLDIDGAVIGIAVDGGAGATSATALFARDSTEAFRVGVATNFGGLNFFLPGSISHIAIWKRVLSQAERAAIHARLDNP